MSLRNDNKRLAIGAIGLICVVTALVITLGARGSSGWRTAQTTSYSWQEPGLSHTQGCAGSPRLQNWHLSFASHSYIVPCGARVQFCYHHHCVIGRRTDSGPFVGGSYRMFDLNIGLARALLGLHANVNFYHDVWGVRVVRWRRVG